MFTVPEVITIINFVLSSVISCLTAFTSHRMYVTHKNLQDSTDNFTRPVGSAQGTPRGASEKKSFVRKLISAPLGCDPSPPELHASREPTPSKQFYYQ